MVALAGRKMRAYHKNALVWVVPQLTGNDHERTTFFGWLAGAVGPSDVVKCVVIE